MEIKVQFMESDSDKMEIRRAVMQSERREFLLVIYTV